jgi:uncharacterized membrane protein
MKSRARLFGHPIHQMLVMFPLGLLATSVIFDIIYLVTENRTWAEVSYWMIYAGLVGAVFAAVFGLIDWLGIPKNTRAKTVGAYHGLINLAVTVLFVVSCIMRMDAPASPPMVAIGISIFAVVLASISAWLGGELVVRLGVGVYEDAHLNAPNSLLTDSEGRRSDRVKGHVPPRHAA